jgi:hypothetical protein
VVVTAKVPRLILWLYNQPWWVGALILAVLVGVVCWAFWPDHKVARAREETERKVRESLDKAWEWHDEYLRAANERAEAEAVAERERAQKYDHLATEIRSALQEFQAMTKRHWMRFEEYERKVRDLETRLDGAAMSLDRFLVLEESLKSLTDKEKNDVGE